jgi:hypothetical protein
MKKSARIDAKNFRYHGDGSGRWAFKNKPIN